MSASSLAGGAIIMKSALWLFVAVVIKCFAFLVLEKRLTWGDSLLFMLLANVLSTIPGVLVAGCAASMSGFFIAVPVMFFLGWVTGPRLSAALNKPSPSWLSSGAAAIGFTLVFFASVAFFEAAGSALVRQDYLKYWILKFIFVTLAVVTGLAISSVLEEFVVAGLARKKLGQTTFYRSVVRANYITLTVVLLAAAAAMLPQRLRSPHFIVSWLHEIARAFGVV